MTRPVLTLAVWLTAIGFSPIAWGEPPPDTPANPENKNPAEVVGEKTKEAAEATAETTKEAVLSFGDDMRGLPWRVWEDIQGLPHWKNAAALTLGAGLAAYSSEEWDARVRADVRNHPDRLGSATNDVLDQAGGSYVFYGLSAATYGVSLFANNQRLHDFALDQVSALTMELPVVFALKKAFHTRRPDGESEGFPSGHTAAAASFAALLNRYYGPIPGFLGAGLAGVVAFHRIDSRHHDLSDVIFGAALGYIAGRTAGDVEEFPVLQAHLLPLDGEQGEHGLRLEWRF
jgi:PAP2 superfamily protein